ncbi:MAG: ATP-dependent DNA helicase RecG [Treponema sp.]|nr:ATP-dependent DNA helicase RecG [Treponema sp.]
MKVSEIKSPVSSLAGVGPKMAASLAKLNIFTIGDLLQHYPRDYEDRTQKIYLKDFNKHQKIHTVAQVIRQEWFGYGNMKTLKVIVTDGTAQAELICFNRAFLEKVLIPGCYITLHGQFFVKYNSLQSSAFEVEVINIPHTDDITSIPMPKTGIIPIYPLTEGLTQKNLQKIIGTAIQQYLHGIENELPEELVQKENLLSKQNALKNIHKPADISQALQARKTLAFEELFLFQTAVFQIALKHKGTLNIQEESSKNLEAHIDDATFKNSLSPLQLSFIEKLTFELTPDQKTVIYQIDSDIDRGYEDRSRLLNQADRGIPLPKKTAFTMQRLLQGDVGSGKTLVSLFACLRIISWKGQCALMAPTEILAKQHAQTASSLLESMGIRIAFLSGNVKSAGRNQLLKALKNGEIDIVIGTHALFSSQVEYKDLEMVIIDEQHRFGVMQRNAIVEKGRISESGLTFEPHLLMMSATPIPQTLALTVYGDLDVSTIKSMPKGRKPITTYLVKEGNEMNAYEAVRKELEKGHQAYFVYPAIDSEDGTVQLKSAERAFEHLSKHIFPQYKCALVHSKISEEEQEKALQDFHDNNIQILAATTVIEVGVDVPNATCMVIEQADRFGMAQLHQLRGRVGRGSDQSYCFLIYSTSITETGIERMKALRQSTDGFYIAEQDLKTRGPGEINGTIQAGQLEFQIADVVRDQDLLTKARTEALNYLKNKSY